MGAIREWLKGKKTYVLAAVTIVGAVVAWSQGEIEADKLAEAIVAALMAMTIRAGMATEGGAK